ncbi:unnamed protein product [Heligmosomoides polygyrus]|uniref:Uncharacterized protein n=1 Tax=Heligmosomoides polygyrus TaxID=6339 RepID=A0A183F3K2_HELPZ|nr:unnamed protein product [Heligmosomoides polygyrus]
MNVGPTWVALLPTEGNVDVKALRSLNAEFLLDVGGREFRRNAKTHRPLYARAHAHEWRMGLHGLCRRRRGDHWRRVPEDGRVAKGKTKRCPPRGKPEPTSSNGRSRENDLPSLIMRHRFLNDWLREKIYEGNSTKASSGRSLEALRITGLPF